MQHQTNTYRILALGAASAAVLAACNFPGLGGRTNAANATNAAATQSGLSTAASNSLGLDSGSGMEGVNMAAPPLPPPGPVNANVPSIRPGRWSQTSITNNGAPEVEAVCLQGGPLRMQFSDDCPVPNPQPGPNGSWQIQTTCTGSMGPVDVRMSSQGDYQNHYSMDAEFSLRPTAPNTPPRSMQVHMEAVYQGPCQGNEAGREQQQQQQQGGQDQGGQQQGGDESGGDK